MYIYLSKILPLFILPLGIVFECLIIAFVLQVKGRRKSSAVFLLAGMAVLWASSTPIVADALLCRLEQQYPAMHLSEIPVSKCIVLLGGSVQPVMPPRVDIDLLDSADRVYKAAGLYHAGKGKIIIISGGNQPWMPDAKSEAEETRSLLMDFGVPPLAIELDETSRNTRENAINTLALLDAGTCKKPLLVTSASHMPRAVATFTKVGVDVFPVSTDIRVVKSAQLTVFAFIPSARALAMTSNAVREWVGQMVYRLRGWN